MFHSCLQIRQILDYNYVKNKYGYDLAGRGLEGSRYRETCVSDPPTQAQFDGLYGIYYIGLITLT